MKKFFGWLILVLSAISVLFAIVYQIILQCQLFGFFAGGRSVNIFIPHWSAWFFAGLITSMFGVVMIVVDETPKNKRKDKNE